MKTFNHSFVVPASLEEVAAFHKDTNTLKALTPPPVFVQIHKVEPLAENSISEFTMWVGPIPMRWVALHTQVDPQHGFTDTQTSGPLAYWQHQHQFIAIDPTSTRVNDTITYQHKPGFVGLFTQIMFSTAALKLMFWYRSMATRAGVKHHA